MRSGLERIILKSTEEAVQAWSAQISKRAVGLAGRGVDNCAPRYPTYEYQDNPLEQSKTSRSGLWGQGIESYFKFLGGWRARGDLQGLETYEHCASCRRVARNCMKGRSPHLQQSGNPPLSVHKRVRMRKQEICCR